MNVIIICILPAYFFLSMLVQVLFIFRKNKESSFWNEIVDSQMDFPDDFYLKDYSIIKHIFFIFYGTVIALMITAPELIFPFLYTTDGKFELINYLAVVLLILNIVLSILFFFVSRKHQNSKERIYSWYNYLYPDDEESQNSYENDYNAPHSSFEEGQGESYAYSEEVQGQQFSNSEAQGFINLLDVSSAEEETFSNVSTENEDKTLYGEYVDLKESLNTEYSKPDLSNLEENEKESVSEAEEKADDLFAQWLKDNG